MVGLLSYGTKRSWEGKRRERQGKSVCFIRLAFAPEKEREGRRRKEQENFVPIKTHGDVCVVAFV